MSYQITHAKSGISFTVAELDYECKDTYVAVQGSTFYRVDGWDWRPALEKDKFYKAVTATGFDVVVARNKYGIAAALFPDGSYDENLPLESLTEIEPL